MQIGENVYFDVKVNGFEEENVISYDNMIDFTLVETAGTSLPYAFISFFTSNKKLAEYFIENNTISVSIGQTMEDAETFKVNLLTNPRNTDPSDNMWTINVGGFLCNRPYMVDKGECKSIRGNSLMVLKKVLKSYEGINNLVSSDFSVVNEKQVSWRWLYETAPKFLVRVLLHMNVQPSFPLFTFDKYGKFYVRDYINVIKNEPVWRFTYANPDGNNEFQYINNFVINTFKPSYNLYSGYNKVTEIYGVEQGIPSYSITNNIPVLSSTEESEGSMSGNRIALNKIQSVNVHDTYMESFTYNTNKLLSLSSMQGVLVVPGYHPKLKPTDLVYIKTPKESGSVSSLEGKYLIDTIRLAPNFRNGSFLTYIYVTRDNNNNIEDFIPAKDRVKNVKIKKRYLEDLLNAVARTRTAAATCSQFMDGTFLNSVRSYATSTKNNLLRMFSVQGIIMDFASQAGFIQSALCLGNSLMNMLVDMVFPEDVAFYLRDFLIEKPTTKTLLGEYISQYVPYELQDVVHNLIDSLCEMSSSLNYIANDNGITARGIIAMNIANLTFKESEDRVDSIMKQFENNTTGLDIPLPIVTLTESQELLNDADLKEYLLTETMANLTDLGYLDNLTENEIQEFEDILMGKTEINFVIINKINASAGETYNYRFWGIFGESNEPLYSWIYKDKVVYTKTLTIGQYTRLFNVDYSPYSGNDFIIGKVRTNVYAVFFKEEDTGVLKETTRDEEVDVTTNALSQLTDFYINKGYKDRYRTLPCTKIISATKNSRIYFACPQREERIKFYINSKRVELESFPIDLGYTDKLGNKILYNVYYTKTGFNSNSNMLEVRQT